LLSVVWWLIFNVGVTVLPIRVPLDFDGCLPPNAHELSRLRVGKYTLTLHPLCLQELVEKRTGSKSATANCWAARWIEDFLA
jgi:hypothetical protein